LVEAKRAIRLPVVTGEELYTKSEFREVFERRAVDIINPDVGVCGGILELREIAAMADAYHIAVSPHNYNSTALGLAATVQAAAGMPNFLLTEYFVNFEETAQAICPDALRPVGSMITLPDRPGLGVTIDEDALAEYSYRAFAPRKLRRPEDEV
jgi:galactonate dehydratase